MDGELLSLKWNNHRTTFLHVIGTLRSKASYTDATLACEGKFYPVHKLVLSTCSEYFGAIFERTPCKSPVVVLKDIECKNLEFLLDYMYIGEVNVRQNELAALIKAAECLRIKGLAVPDEDPLNTFSSKGRSDSQRESSPPAKRRRNVRSNSPDKKQRELVESASDKVGLDRASSKDIDDSPVEEGITPIKLEPLDDAEVSNFLSNSNVSVNDRVSDEGGGGGEGAREDSTSEMQEFFGGKVETEEVHIGDYSSADFAGPSGVQNSNLPPWDNENSFPPDHLLATSSSQLDSQQQQQQQQLHKPREMCYEEVGEYSFCPIKKCYVLIPPALNDKPAGPVKMKKKRGRPPGVKVEKVENIKIEKNVKVEIVRKKMVENSSSVPLVKKVGKRAASQQLANNPPEADVKPNASPKDNEIELPKLFSVNPVLKLKKRGKAKRKRVTSLNRVKKLKICVNSVTAKKSKMESLPKYKLKKFEDRPVGIGDNEDDSLKKKHYCVHCNYSTVFKKCLVKHNLKRHAGELSELPETVQPETSPVTESNNDVILKNEDTECEEFMEHRCSYCDYVTTRKRSLTYHLKNNHIEPGSSIQDSNVEDKPFSCSLCLFRTANMTSLKSHTYFMHSDAGTKKQYRCAKCDYASNRVYNLNAHLRTHGVIKRCNNKRIKKKLSGKLKVKVKVLPSKLMQKRIITKIHACQNCDCKFVFAHSLANHEKMHQRKDKRVCRTCKKRASQQKFIDNVQIESQIDDEIESQVDDEIESQVDDVQIESQVDDVLIENQVDDMQIERLAEDIQIESQDDDQSPVSNEPKLLKCENCDFETEFEVALEEHREVEHSNTLMIKKVFSIKKEKDLMLFDGREDIDF